jgi:Tfp pilus assembly protein PilX
MMVLVVLPLLVMVVVVVFPMHKRRMWVEREHTRYRKRRLDELDEFQHGRVE